MSAGELHSRAFRRHLLYRGTPSRAPPSTLEDGVLPPVCVEGRKRRELRGRVACSIQLYHGAVLLRPRRHSDSIGYRLVVLLAGFAMRTFELTVTPAFSVTEAQSWACPLRAPMRLSASSIPCSSTVMVNYLLSSWGADKGRGTARDHPACFESAEDLHALS